MKFCLPHWDKLRESVKQHGLSEFILSAAEAAKQMVADLDSGAQETGTAYCPLSRATVMIYGKAMEWGGQYMLTTEPQPCPVCEALKHTVGMSEAYGQTEPVTAEWVEDFWINGPVKSIQDHFRTLGLIPKVQ